MLESDLQSSLVLHLASWVRQAFAAALEEVEREAGGGVNAFLETYSHLTQQCLIFSPPA